MTQNKKQKKPRTKGSMYMASKCRKEILATLKQWGGSGVENPNELMTYIDYEIQNYLNNLSKLTT